MTWASASQRVTLTVNGIVFANWQSMTLTRDLRGMSRLMRQQIKHNFTPDADAKQGAELQNQAGRFRRPEFL